MKQSTLWWNGPEWLKDDFPSWSIWNVEKINQKTIDKTQSKVKGPVTLYEATIFFLDLQESRQIKKMTPFGIYENKYPSSTKLLRITAYANCFVQKLKQIPTPKGTNVRRDTGSKKAMDKSFTRKTLSSHLKWEDEAQQNYRRELVESQIGRRWDHQMLWENDQC